MPYVGCMFSGLAMDKVRPSSAGIGRHCLDYLCGAGRWRDLEQIEIGEVDLSSLHQANMGSSVGISKSDNQAELRASLDLAFQ